MVTGASIVVLRCVVRANVLLSKLKTYVIQRESDVFRWVTVVYRLLQSSSQVAPGICTASRRCTTICNYVAPPPLSVSCDVTGCNCGLGLRESLASLRTSYLKAYGGLSRRDLCLVTSRTVGLGQQQSDVGESITYKYSGIVSYIERKEFCPFSFSYDERTWARL